MEDLVHSANSSGGIMLVPEFLDQDAPRPAEPAEFRLSVGKAQVDELSVDKLTVAGTELSGMHELEPTPTPGT